MSKDDLLSALSDKDQKFGYYVKEQGCEKYTLAFVASNQKQYERLKKIRKTVLTKSAKTKTKKALRIENLKEKIE